MSRTQRLSFALLLLAPACSDDVSGTDDTDSTGSADTTTDSGDTPGTTLTTTINPPTTGEPTTSSTTVDPDSSTGEDTIDPTDPASSSSSGDPTDGSSSTGDPTEGSSSTGSLMCGNALVDGDEDCDGDQLADGTCETEGFVSGDLACTKACVYDVTGCETCGDGVVDVGDVCDGDDLNGADCTTLGMGFTGGTLACDIACEYDMSACTSEAMPVLGEVIVTEIQKDPNVVSDADGEWFELHNPSETDSYQLTGCVVEGTDDESFTIMGDLLIGPGEYVTFAPESEADIGFLPDVTYTGFNLVNNNIDRVALVCAKILVDEVVYDETFPDTTGASLNLDPGSFDAISNDAFGNWCDALTDYNGDLGTPGAENDVCPVPVVYTIDRCYLQDPLTITDDQGTVVPVYGRVDIPGLTELNDTNDTAPEVDAYFGYGPDGSDPSVDDTGWTWSVASSNDGYNNLSPGFDADADEYTADFTLPDAGDYDYAFRFSGDDSATFSYCDATPDTAGYLAADAGQLTSEEVTVEFSLYFSEYIEGGSNDKAVEIFNPGVEEVDTTGCFYRIYANGSDTPTGTFALTTPIAAGGTHVLCNPSMSDTTNCDETTVTVNFNGDDAVDLACGATVLDVIGTIGMDPGSSWSMGGVSTQDEVLRRLCTTGPDTDGSDAYDPSAEWATFDDLLDFSDLGQYICD